MYEKKRAAGPACPLCGKPNQCGIATGAPGCWCMRTEVPASLLERLPDVLRGVICVCEDCVRAELAEGDADGIAVPGPAPEGEAPSA